ncbi:hypothetical protein As57867_023163, partial [Aphanomyces stellatus]
CQSNFLVLSSSKISDFDSAIRSGDAFTLLVSHACENDDYAQATELVNAMRQRNISIKAFISQKVLSEIQAKTGDAAAPERNEKRMEDKKEAKEADVDEMDEEIEGESPTAKYNGVIKPQAVLQWEAEIVAYLDKCSLSKYATPYLTCSLCNCINFIDVTCVRGIKNVAKGSLFEFLPPCCGCNRTRHLRTGAASFQLEIEQESQTSDDLEKKREPAAINMQRVVRGRLGRLEARRRRLEKERWEKKIFHAASVIQKRVRGIQARTRVEIERCIFVVVNAHPLVYAFATTNQPGMDTVFWYDSVEEFGVFCWDYREFVRRTGGRPSLWRVEANVREVARRVLRRENVLVTRIQARWRGITARSSFYELKKQHGWVRTLRHAPTIRIQRLARMHKARRRCKRLRVYVGRDDQLADYFSVHEKKAAAARRRHLQMTLMLKYREHFKHKRAAKLVGGAVEPFKVVEKGRFTSSGEGVSLSKNQSDDTPTTQRPNRFMQAKAKMDVIAKRRRGPFPTILRQQMMGDQDDRQGRRNEHDGHTHLFIW